MAADLRCPVAIREGERSRPELGRGMAAEVPQPPLLSLGPTFPSHQSSSTITAAPLQQQCHSSTVTAALPQQLCHSSLLQAPDSGAVPCPLLCAADWEDFPLFFLCGALFADHQLSPTPVLHNLLARFKKRSCSKNVHSRLPLDCSVFQRDLGE